uniref:Uncharacterized protein n=1 Tax=Anguilla anguilla TaxID=7936 RepID=A0A0E9QCG6_ANGAN
MIEGNLQTQQRSRTGAYDSCIKD